MNGTATQQKRSELRDQARERVIAMLAADKPNAYDRGDLDLNSVDADDPLYELFSDVCDARSDLLSTRDQLSREMQRAREEMASAEQFIRGGSARFNSLGILQGSGPAIDRLCGLFDVQVSAAVKAEFRLLWAIAKR